MFPERSATAVLLIDDMYNVSSKVYELPMQGVNLKCHPFRSMHLRRDVKIHESLRYLVGCAVCKYFSMFILEILDSILDKIHRLSSLFCFYILIHDIRL